MGAWGYGIFENDLSSDVLSQFEELIESGESVVSASEQILEAYQDELDDEDEKADVYFALAALQLRANELDPTLREIVLQLLDEESTLAIWAESGEEAYEARKTVLAQLKSELLHQGE